MVCLTMLTRSQSSSAHGSAKRSQQANDQGNSAARSTATRSDSSAAPILGILNVYLLGGDIEVVAALEKEPQQIHLPYAPVGVAHVQISRGTGGSAGKGSRDPGVERGDAILVWASDGLLHGFTRWNHQTSGVDNGNGNTLLKEVSQQTLEGLIPELKGIRSPVLSLATDVALDPTGAWRRTIIAGCTDGVRLMSTDVTSGRTRSISSSLPGRITTVQLDSLYCGPDGGSDPEGVAGFACSDRGSMACLTLAVTGPGESLPAGAWTGVVPLKDGAKVLCMGCADFCRDGSTSVAIGTSSGTVAVFDGNQEGGSRQHAEERRHSADRSFGLEWNTGETLPPERSRRVESFVSSRPPSSEWQRAPRKPSQAPSKPRSVEARWRTHVPYSVWGITAGDFNNDGVSEMVVTTMHGVHIFRPDYREEASRLHRILSALERLQPAEEEAVHSGSDDPGAADRLMGLEFLPGPSFRDAMR